MKGRAILFSVVISFAGMLLAMILSGPLSGVEEQFTSARYKLRGNRIVDTNVVVVYVDNEAIQSLGWPVRRNFHALMVKALSDLQVGAIGIDIQFETPSPEYPEYDDLLANVLASSGNVVLTSYFGSLSDDVAQPGKKAVLSGTGQHLPLPAFLKAAAGTGHGNITDGGKLPLFVQSGDVTVPAFALEVLRVYKGLSRDSISYSGGEPRLASPEKIITLFTDTEAQVSLDFPLQISSIRSYPFLEVLKSYDALRADQKTTIPVASFKGKLVLLGVIAEGRSTFLNTPVSARFPSLLYHAVFIDNALRGSFMTSMSDTLVYLLCFIVGCACALSVLLLPSSWGKVSAPGVMVLSGILSWMLFVQSSYIFPLMPVFVVGVISTIGSIFYKHRFVSRQVDALLLEKDSILERLKDREAKVAVLERELMDFESKRSSDRTAELLEEIRKYKAEIRALGSQADDMEAYVSGAGIEADGSVFEQIVYEKNGAMKPVIDFVGKIAGSEAPVLILGESGTGKELIARAIHKRSRRSNKPFLAVHCGALAESLLESELFGHERGAFTGAIKEKPGRFELAHEGTIFLDEIGEVSESFQLKLLRVLQEGELERVGGTKTIKVNVRVLAATNKNLKDLVKTGKFREDLFYRLNVLLVEVPALSERPEDIPLLVKHFLHRESESEMRVSKNVMEALQNYPWPGNIRELESAVKRAVLLARAESRSMITMKDLTGEVSSAIQGSVAVEDRILDAVREKGFSRSSITETGAELGGLNRGTVAEHLRGQFLKAFVEHRFDIEQAVKYLSLSNDEEINERVGKRLREYLQNLQDAVDKSKPWDSSKALLKPKVKNLPHRFHVYVEQTAEAYFRGLWRLDEG